MNLTDEILRVMESPDFSMRTHAERRDGGDVDFHRGQVAS